MGKIIIENRSSKTMLECLPLITNVIEQGKVSKTSKGEQYCFATVFGDGTAVYADINKRSDRFIVTNGRPQ